MRLTTVVACLLGLAACLTSEPAPVEGTWLVERTLATVSDGCPRLSLSSFELVVADGVTLRGVTRNENFEPLVSDTGVSFSTHEYAYPDSLDPVLIGHQLAVAGDQLYGDASARGDGERIDCRWTIGLVATRQ
jgi:hypothetical protein